MLKQSGKTLLKSSSVYGCQNLPGKNTNPMEKKELAQFDIPLKRKVQKTSKNTIMLTNIYDHMKLPAEQNFFLM